VGLREVSSHPRSHALHNQLTTRMASRMTARSPSVTGRAAGQATSIGKASDKCTTGQHRSGHPGGGLLLLVDHGELILMDQKVVMLMEREEVMLLVRTGAKASLLVEFGRAAPFALSEAMSVHVVKSFAEFESLVAGLPQGSPLV
jgi:hypothetical protein